MTPDERDPIDPVVAVSGTDVTDFDIGSVLETSRRVLADRDRIMLDAEAAIAWDALHARPARELPGLRRLMDRPSPF